MTRKYRYKYKKPYRVKKKKPIFHSRFFWLGLFILVIFGAIFYLVVFAPFFQIKEIIIIGNEKVSTEEIKSILEQKINRQVAFFSSKSIFLSNLKETEKKILEKFPQILTINLKRTFPDILIAEIKERLPVGTWCQTCSEDCQPCLAGCQDNECFYFDEFGIVFEKNPQKLQPPIIKPENPNPDLALGKLIIEQKYLDAILKIDKDLEKNLNLSIEDFIISGDGKNLTVFLSEGWQIFFDLDSDISEQIFNLELVLKEKIPPEKRTNLQYINLRFGTKVYYKYKD